MLRISPNLSQVLGRCPRGICMWEIFNCCSGENPSIAAIKTLALLLGKLCVVNVPMKMSGQAGLVGEIVLSSVDSDCCILAIIDPRRLPAKVLRWSSISW